MSADPRFLTLDQILEIHRTALAEHGGSDGLRDHGLLSSAGAMPLAQFGGEYLHTGIPAMAAAYLFHLCNNHAFVDDNMRVSMVAAEIFIRLNGIRMVATDKQLEKVTLGVADGTISKQQLIEFFESHVRK